MPAGHATGPGWFVNRSPTITLAGQAARPGGCPGPGSGMHRARAGARLVKLPDAARYTRGPVWLIGRPRSARFRQDFPPNRQPPVAGGSWDPRSLGASALRMSRREMLRERQVAAPLMARRAARGALRPAH